MDDLTTDLHYWRTRAHELRRERDDLRTWLTQLGQNLTGDPTLTLEHLTAALQTLHREAA